MSSSGISRIGIVGAGIMGRRIAFSCVMSGVEVRLFDVVSDLLPRARDAVCRLIKDADGDTATMDYLLMCDSLADCVDNVDLVIETVPEDLELKRKVFADIDKLAPSGTLFASNASSIVGSRIADVLGDPSRLINVNFSSPDEAKVEVMGHPGSAPETVDRVVSFIRDIGLIPLVVQHEITGYVQNRLWRAVKKEVLSLLAGGYSTPDDIDRGWVLDFGGSLGPCAIMDEVGLDVVRDIENVYFAESGDPSDKPPEFLETMIRDGKLGVKSGEGFYKYPNPTFEQDGWLDNAG